MTTQQDLVPQAPQEAPRELMPAITRSTAAGGVFNDIGAFENAQRMAKLLCASTLVPKEYQGAQNIGNALIALELAHRINASPLMVMQSLDIIHGRPSWRAQFIISALNASGLFSPIRFAMSGEGDGAACVAWAIEKASGERLDGPEVSIRMAKDEGWFAKNGSKWKTMPELMLRYRAAAFFGRLYAPHILNGMQTTEEVIDVEAVEVSQPRRAVSLLQTPVDDGDDTDLAPTNAEAKA